MSASSAPPTASRGSTAFASGTCSTNSFTKKGLAWSDGARAARRPPRAADRPRSRRAPAARTPSRRRDSPGATPATWGRARSSTCRSDLELLGDRGGGVGVAETGQVAEQVVLHRGFQLVDGGG